MVRSIGSILRGKATPTQITLACTLGAAIGFAPSFSQAPALWLTLIGLLVMLNANLMIAAMAGGLAGLASYPLTGVSFYVGRGLLDGPTQALFAWAINAPVLAYFGLERYTTTGGLAVGTLLGLLLGVALVRGVAAFRRRMAKLEEASPTFQRLASSWWARLLAFVLVGKGHGKKSYAQLMERRAGRPVRLSGVALVAAVALAGLLGRSLLTEPIVTNAVRTNLERINGATVDLERVSLDVSSGGLTLIGLAMADPGALGKDAFRAQTLRGDLSVTDLLRRRFTLDNVTIDGAVVGGERATRGRRVGTAPSARRAPAPAAPPDGKALEEYVAQAELWRGRLSQLARWAETFATEPSASAETETDAAQETLRQRLKRQSEAQGYRSVLASHLIERTPRLTIRALSIAGVRAEGIVGEELIDITGANVSTEPWLLDEAGRLRVASSGDSLSIELTTDGEGVELAVRIAGLPADRVAKLLAPTPEPLLTGGEVDVRTRARLANRELRAPVRVVVRNSTIVIPGAGSARVERFVLPIDVGGWIDDPRVRIDDDALAQALVDAGAQELAARARREIEKEIGDKIGEEATGLIEGLLGGDKKKPGGKKPPISPIIPPA